MAADTTLHVTTADLKRAVIALRSLGLRLLADLLRERNGLAVEHWLSPADANVFGPVPLRRLGWRRALLRWRSASRISAPAIAFQRRTALIAAASARAERDRLALWRLGEDGSLIPGRMLPLIGRRAWESEVFRCGVARLLTSHVQDSMVVSMAGLPVPQLDPAIIWLVLLSSPVREPRYVGLRPSLQRRRRVIRRLQHAAREILDGTPPPDGFWDSWIAWHLARRGREPFPASWPRPVEVFDGAFAEAVDLVLGQRSRQASGRARVLALQAMYSAWNPCKRGPASAGRHVLKAGEKT